MSNLRISNLRLAFGAAVLGLLFTAPGCVQHIHKHRPTPRIVHSGPPPHAPAHGYRHKLATHGLELVFDTELGAYAVVGHPGHFFHAGRYYRRVVSGRNGSVWHVTGSFGRGWKVVRVDRLPASLRLAFARAGHHKHGKKDKHAKKHKRRDRHPAKHDY